MVEGVERPDNSGMATQELLPTEVGATKRVREEACECPQQQCMIWWWQSSSGDS